MVPIVRDADAKGLAEIAADVKQLAAKVGVVHGKAWRAVQRSSTHLSKAQYLHKTVHVLLGVSHYYLHWRKYTADAKVHTNTSHSAVHIVAVVPSKQAI